jgi:radical SAM superfamily enzyme YgiQ (UPF0313 family)
MRIVLADIKASEGYVAKDTVAGGYGARLVPFTRVTSVYSRVKRAFHSLPSVQMAYLAAIAAQKGHDVVFARDEVPGGDVALVLSSLVDYRQETAWADVARSRGIKVGFIGLAASQLPELFAEHADFIIRGEPESAMRRLVSGERLQGVVSSPPLPHLDELPFPRWDLVNDLNRRWLGLDKRFGGNRFPLLASRGCPETCVYCPHRISAEYRVRSVRNIAEELDLLCERYPNPYVIFRDALFTEDRDRCLELCDEIRTRNLHFSFAFETRQDRLDDDLLDQFYAAGLRAISFGVESVRPDTLRRMGRRLIPESKQRAVVEACSHRGITTMAFYVFGFPQDDWASISATIEYSIALGSTFAQYKLLTPYPGTPLWKGMKPLIIEEDWQRFDGFTPTFVHPNLTAKETRFLLGAAYSRFYMRPSFLSNYLQIRNERVRGWVQLLDEKSRRKHDKLEHSIISRTVSC